jgi:DNA processing protein
MYEINTIKAFYRLSDQKSIGLSLAHRIVSDMGNPVQYIGRRSELWDSISYIKDEIKASLQQDIDPPNWSKIMDFCENSHRFQFITIFDEAYPDTLKNIYHPPLFLTAYGDASILNSDSIISIVGTRKPTYYGKKMTEKIVISLVTNDFITCSGLALGIDTVVHKSTIDNTGRTVAVLACGLDNVYPPQNKDLARQIIEHGVVISENMPFSQLEKFHFPQRNRIISGICKAICVIEGKHQSGALVTARFALDQNRDIYALPGDVGKPESEGPNALIAKGAKIIMTPGDIVADYKVGYKAVKTEKIFIMTEEESMIYNIMADHPPEIHMDQLINHTGFTIGKMSELLLRLELKNAIRTTENGKYALC